MGSRVLPIEITALARIVDELDYYQVLGLRPEAQASEIKRAYHETARSLHPDANRHLKPHQLADCERIAKRISEAYCVLRDPRQRKAYDAHRLDHGGPRLQLGELRSRLRSSEAPIRSGRTQEGRQFWERATDDLAREDWAGAIRNLQTALTFEPDNEVFRVALTRARDALQDEKAPCGARPETGSAQQPA
ncbi:MAG: DnaJ domain-containing protein [Myxococcota bacterium]|nr:DnaJ domain-containing protein [Myxococcota bacterium]